MVITKTFAYETFIDTAFKPISYVGGACMSEFALTDLLGFSMRFATMLQQVIMMRAHKRMALSSSAILIYDCSLPGRV